jgi:hypothetical protein
MKRLLVRRLRSENAQAYRGVLVEGLILHPDRFVEDYSAEVARPLTDIEADLEQNGMFGAWLEEKLVGIAGYSRLRSPKRQHCGIVRSLYVKNAFERMASPASFWATYSDMRQRTSINSKQR